MIIDCDIIANFSLKLINGIYFKTWFVLVAL